ncbi:MAG TPA: hypothetical protein VMD49_10790 [Steroidobacteraceae bacterium]|nr:hypothetical protein [Steroidobacteraceae bacterium]
MTDNETNQKEKEIEWYAAALDAWYSTRLEHDKSLLTLASGGIALLVGLLSTEGVKSVESLILFVLALTSFALCLAAVLWIFSRNSTHIEDAVNRDVSHDPILAALDAVAVSTFLAGVVFSCVIGLAAAVRSLNTGASSMPVDDRKVVYANDSVNGIHAMKPGIDKLSKSFNGTLNLAPKQGTTLSQAPAQVSTSSQTAAATQPAQASTPATPAASTPKTK